MAARRLIVHGDDFGLSESVNEGIIDAHCHGILTSTSLIASGTAFLHAVRLARDIPSLDVGVHLTLVGEKPVSPRSAIPSLLGSDGLLHRDAGSFVKRYIAGAISLEEIQHELDAQIAKVLAAGVRATHLDGHQHLHMLPRIRRAVGGLATQYGIRCIRYPSETPRFYMLQHGRNIARLCQLLVLDTFCMVARTSDAKRSDHFFGFYYGGRLSKENLKRVLEHLPAAGTCELMCHPGRHDPTPRYSHWGYSWREERDALTDKSIRGYLETEKIELISYADL